MSRPDKLQTNAEFLSVPASAPCEVGRRPSQIEIRALNPDNAREIGRLIELYRRCYGDVYPFQRVYRPSFWAGQGASRGRGDRFVNLVAADGKDFAGHLGLKIDALSRRVEIFSIAVDMARRQNIFRTGEQAWQALEQLAGRQRWSALFFFCPLVHAAIQVLAVKCFHSQEIALLPDYLQHAGIQMSGFAETGTKPGVLVMHNTLRAQSGRLRRLYPPARHAEMIASLYEPLHLKRAWCFDYRSIHGREGVGVCGQTGYSGGAPAGVKVEFRRRYGLCHLWIDSAQVKSAVELSSYIERMGQNREGSPYIQVRLDAPCCPAICGLLEEQGYHFCGALPDFERHDFLAYARFDPEAVRQNCLYSKRAKRLWDYILRAALR